jgi:hypothetical protein
MASETKPSSAMTPFEVEVRDLARRARGVSNDYGGPSEVIAVDLRTVANYLEYVAEMLEQDRSEPLPT